jgi:hypothetical protein
MGKGRSVAIQMKTPSDIRYQRRWLALAVTIGVVIAIGLAFVDRQHITIIRLLETNQLREARAKLNHFHSWTYLLTIIEKAGNPELTKAALDVQFVYWYSDREDTNYPYREQVEVVAQLIALGAGPGYEHLLASTQQRKLRTARLLLAVGVPAYLADAEDSALANAAYFGDLELVRDLVQRGADINHGSITNIRPVLAAAWAGQTNCVRFFLDNGADVSLPHQVWKGNIQPLWRVIEDRADQNPERKAVWEMVRQHVAMDSN